MNRPLLLSIAVIFILFVTTSCNRRCHISPSLLKVEHRENPSVIESSSPRMAWIDTVTDPKLKGVAQSAYRIIVASSEDNIKRNIGDMWDSGIVRSSDSYLVRYAGKTLADGKTYWWKVRVADNNGRMSDWSDVATFGTGLSSASWKAKWIGAPWMGEEASPEYQQAPLFSKTFNVNRKGLQSAKAFVTGLGYFELSLNGEKVGDDVLAPNFTNFGSRPGLVSGPLPLEDRFTGASVLYLAYDITDNLNNGSNVIEALVGNGFFNSNSRMTEPYGSPRFICQINLEYEDGHVENIITDESWLAAPSKIVFNDIHGGEIYDANVDTEKKRSVVIRNSPEGVMRPHLSAADKVIGRMSPKSLKKLDDGAFEVEFDEEVAGWIALSGMKGEKGDTVVVKYESESPLGVHKYIMNGIGEECYAPRFTWYVFSKARIYGLESLSENRITAEVVATDVPLDANFHSSDTLLNKIQDMWLLTQTDNMHGGFASDCPHRERLPYTGDGQVACAMTMANYDAAAFYEKWIRDICESQDPLTGYVPNGAPWQPTCGGGVAWGAAIHIMPWEHYLNYGDISILESTYDAMKQHISYMESWVTPEGTMLQKKGTPQSDEPLYWLNLGDWLPPFQLPSDELVHTFYLWLCADNTAKTAIALGKDNEARKYNELADKTRNAYFSKFYDATTKSCGHYGGNVFALAMGAPEELKSGIVESLRHEIEDLHDSHITTGICGTRYLFNVLIENGMADLAYKAITREGFPGYVNWLENGSTTMWENWNGADSHNHPMFGGGLVVLYRDFAGINYDPQQPGFRHVIVNPKLVEGLEHVQYSKQTPYGLVSSKVCNTHGNRSIEVTIPVGSNATVLIPGSTEPVEIGQGTHIFNF